MMQIPVISDNVLTNLENNLEHEFSAETEKNAEDCAKKGIFEMEVLLGLDGEGSYRRNITEHWRKYKYLDDHMTKREKIILWSGFVFGFALIPLFVIFLVSMSKRQPSEFPLPLYMFLFVALFSMLTIMPMKIIQKKQKSGAEEAIAKMDPHEMFDYSSSRSMCHFYPNPALMGICEALDIDPEEVKPDFGKVSGGGSTYVGWGSGAVVGTAIGLSALSGMRARSKNSSINYRIEKLENYQFYNNVAAHFNSAAASTLL